MFRVGAIYSYSYLWAREWERGEESGRKDRRVCLVLRPPRFPDLLILFPITSRPPSLGRAHDAVPPGECGRVGLEEPAWIILDEYNVALASAPHDFGALEAWGEFSPDYVKKLAGIVASLLAQKRLRKVVRT